MIAASLTVLAGLGVVLLMRGRAAALRHWTLSVALLCAAVAPALSWVVPGWSLSIARGEPAAGSIDRQDDLSTLTSADPIAAPTVAAGRINRASVRRLAAGVWAGGAVLSLCMLAAGFVRLRRLMAGATRLEDGTAMEMLLELTRGQGVSRPVRLLSGAHPWMVVTFGWRRPVILLPARASDWSAERLRIVLLHELAHIRRGDWLAQMLAELLRSAYWFNPCFWVANWRLRLEAERACDDEVLASGVEGTEYAAQLVDIARAAAASGRAGGAFPAPAMVRPSGLERRITAMLDHTVDRAPVAGWTRAAAGAALFAATVVCAGFGAVEAQSRFSGSVVDPMDSAVPRVSVTLVNLRSRAQFVTESDASGRFEFANVPAGDYMFRTEMPGFSPLEGRVTIASQDVQRRMAMQVGSVRETVTLARSRGAAADPPPAPGPEVVKATAPCGTATAGGNLRPPRKTLNVPPSYPGMDLAGTVVLDTQIERDGSVGAVAVRQPANPALADAAAQAVRLWRFQPTLLNCTAIATPMVVSVNFELR